MDISNTKDSFKWQALLIYTLTELTKHKKDYDYDTGNPIPGLGQVQKYGLVQQFNGIPTPPLLITRSPTAIHHQWIIIPCGK